MTATSIEKLMEAARASNPDLWERTESVAKIIAPEAFMEDWVIHPPESATLFALKLKVLQGNAMRKAQDILAYLGVNTEADWYDILTRLAEER